jgi:AraC-like DNA-binding protein
MVDIRPDVLERVAGERLGVDRAPVRFLASAPVSRAMEAHWRGIVGYAWTNVVQVDEVFRNDLIRVATFEAVVAAALAAFPMTVAEPWRLRADAVRSPAIRRALCYIEEHPDRALTVGEIAAAAGCSVRALQQGFRRQLDTTPLEHVRRVRLHEVRAELLDADAAERGVTEIARRWGFGNLGRFAAAYRAEFGENPTATLHR